MPRLRCLLALLVLVASLAAAGPAAAAPDMRFTADITGTHVIHWEYRGELFPETCKPWGAGSGEQAIGFSTEAKMKIGGYLDGERLSLSRETDGRWKTVLSRKGTWNASDPLGHACTGCGPLSEYGPCQEPPKLGPWDCTTRKLKGTSARLDWVGAGQAVDQGDEDKLAVLDDSVVIGVFVDPNIKNPDKNCPPRVNDRNVVDFHHKSPAIVIARAGLLDRLRVGRSLTLHGTKELGYRAPIPGRADELADCKKIEVEHGYQECSTTDIRVKLRRVR
jgi:hypothetical protein